MKALEMIMITRIVITDHLVARALEVNDSDPALLEKVRIVLKPIFLIRPRVGRLVHIRSQLNWNRGN